MVQYALLVQTFGLCVGSTISVLSIAWRWIMTPHDVYTDLGCHCLVIFNTELLNMTNVLSLGANG